METIFYIFNQQDLYNFFNDSNYIKGLLYNDITVDVGTWTVPGSLGSVRILDGTGKTITLTGTNLNWTGLMNISGGTIQNFTLDNSITSL
jgi:hypothetical protein